MELFSSRTSVDQDLSVIVAETINDDDVKQRLVPIVFHASVTQQRSSGSKTRISCSHVHERTNSCHPCKQGFEKKGATQTDAENMKNSGDKTDRVTMRSTTHTSNYVCVQTKKGKTQLLNSRQRNQGYQKTWSAQRIQTISKHASRPLFAEHDRGLFIQFVTKLRDPWPSEHAETQKLLHTEGRKTTSILTKMS